MHSPYLTQAKAPLTSDISVLNEFGERQRVSIPAERALTVYVDKRELVTLMTLGAHPELLVLGYLRNQRLLQSLDELESITVDWDVGAAAVKTRHGIAGIEEKTAHRVVTTGCGQGSVFGGLMDEVDQIALPADVHITQSQLYSLVNTIRLKETTYKSAGSVHACALFTLTADGPQMQLFVEDVGRHNAIDTIAGWMWMNSGVEMAPMLPVARGSLPPEGAVPPQAGLAAERAPTLPVARGSLPPEGAVPPQGGLAAERAPTLPAARGSLPLEGAVPPQGGLAAERLPTLPAAASGGLVFYTTGRLTSEMVIKSAQMGVPIVVSRSGITQMGHQVAEQVGLCTIGRATNQRFLCYTGSERLRIEPGLVRKPETALAAKA